MILVDTTVVVAYLRSANPQLPALFAAHQAAICGITRAEILHGALRLFQEPPQQQP